MLKKTTVNKDLSRFISDRTNSISPSGIRKFFDLLANMQGVISLGIGEPDYSTPWHISEAAVKSLERGYTMYTSNSGIPELRELTAKHLKGKYGLNYDPYGELLMTVGVSEALDLAMRAIINPGDEVIMTDPHYVAYDASVLLAEGVPARPGMPENNFEVSIASKKIRTNVRAFPKYCAPELMEIAAMAKKHDLIVISDIRNLTYGCEHTCCSLPGVGPYDTA